MPDVINFFQNDGINVIAKILFLIPMFVYIIFTLQVYSRIKALNRTIFLASQQASSALNFLTLVFFLASISLFLITLVIV